MPITTAETAPPRFGRTQRPPADFAPQGKRSWTVLSSRLFSIFLIIGIQRVYALIIGESRLFPWFADLEFLNRAFRRGRRIRGLEKADEFDRLSP